MNKDIETLKKVSDVTVERPVQITVDVNPQGRLHRILQRWGILPKKRVFELGQIKLGTLIRISRYLLEIEMTIPDRNNLLEVNYKAIDEHGEKLAIIIAMAIQNSKADVSKKLVMFIMQNFTTKELFGVLSIVVQQMDLTSFMSSIISIKGMNVLATGKPANAQSVNGNEVSL